MEKKIIWTSIALLQLDEIHNYLFEVSKSIGTANKVVDDLYTSVNILKTQGQIYELDELKIHNDGSIRAFHLYSYRISYKISPSEIYILRIRHTSRNPLQY